MGNQDWVNAKLVEGIYIENMQDYYVSVEPLLKKYNKQLLNISTYQVAIHYQAEGVQDLLLNILLNEEQVENRVEYSSQQKKELINIYQHMMMIENHIEKIIIKYEGEPFSSDKSRFLINNTILAIKEGRVLSWEYGDDYWLVKNGSPEKWDAYIRSIPLFYDGEINKVLMKQESLITEIEAHIQERGT